MAAEADAAQGPKAADEEDDLQLAPEDVKYKTIEQMSTDIKGLDEVCVWCALCAFALCTTRRLRGSTVL